MNVLYLCVDAQPFNLIFILLLKLMSINHFDPKRLKFKKNKTTQLPKPKNRPPANKPGEKFLKGPIPWKWIVPAARQPGKALHVAIALWFLAGILKSRQIRLNNILLRTLGVTRYAKHRGLLSLEKTGLVSVEQLRGKSPIVTLLDPPNENTNGCEKKTI